MSYEPEYVVSQALTGIASATPYTELAIPPFEGFAVCRGGVGGVFLARRPDGTARLFEAANGRMLRMSRSSVLYAVQNPGAYGGTLYLECYARRPKEPWGQLARRVKIGGAGNVFSPAPPLITGTDSTLGTFTPTGSGTDGVQIFKAGTIMPLAGATKPCVVLIGGAAANTVDVFIGESTALNVASNNPVGPAEQIIVSVPAGGKLWAGSAASAKVGARVRA